MLAISITKYGAPDVLQSVERPQPQPAHDEIVVRVRATAVNRADVLQRQGHYPPPKDVSQDVPGLEFAGEVAVVGTDVSEYKVGDRVFGLAGGGTYAEFLSVHARTVAPIPANLSFVEAAAVPEAFVTAYDAMVSQCDLSAGETVLITAVGSGVGTAAVQIASAIGALSIGVSRTASKLERAGQLGLGKGIVSESGEFADACMDATAGRGVDVAVELVGGRYVVQDVRCAATKGRIIVVGLMAGAKAEMDLGLVLRKRLTIKGTTLRMRPLEEKILAGQLLARHLAPLFANGKLTPIIDRTFPLRDAAAAHAYMESNENFGKIVLEV